jgi:hypothetical protein
VMPTAPLAMMRRLAIQRGRQSHPAPAAAGVHAARRNIHINPRWRSMSRRRARQTDLTGMRATRALGESGGGNMEVAMPEKATNFAVAATTGGARPLRWPRTTGATPWRAVESLSWCQAASAGIHAVSGGQGDHRSAI